MVLSHAYLKKVTNEDRLYFYNGKWHLNDISQNGPNFTSADGSQIEGLYLVLKDLTPQMLKRFENGAVSQNITFKD